jgi:hypothetical protein
MVVADPAISGALLVVHSPTSVGPDDAAALLGGGDFWSSPEHPRSNRPARQTMRDLNEHIGEHPGERRRERLALRGAQAAVVSPYATARVIKV